MAAIAISILTSAGIAAASGASLTGIAATGGLALGSTLLNRWSTKPSDNPAKALVVREKQIKAAVVEGQWIIGKPRASGALVRYSEERFFSETPTNSPEVLWGLQGTRADIFEEYPTVGIPWLVARQIVVFSENTLSSLDHVWVEGKPMPFEEHNGIVTTDIEAWNGRILDLVNRRAEIVSGDPGDVTNKFHPNYPLYADLTNEINNLRSELNYSGWNYPLAGGNIKVSVARMYFDFGEAGVSSADIKCNEIMTRLAMKSQTNEKNMQELNNFGTFWDGSADILKGLCWALIETRSWPQRQTQVNERSPEHLEWSSNPPKIEIVSEGMSDNPAEIAKWYLVERCGVEEDDLIGFDTAREICEQEVIIDPVSVGDENLDKDITSYDVYKAIYPEALNDDGTLNPALLPDVATRTAALIEWNNIYSGIRNAEQRYQCHGLITSSMMLKADELLQGLGEAMGGWIINVAGKYKFIAGSASLPATTIESADVTREHITWTIGPSLRENINAIRAEISQSKQKDYVQTSLGTVEDNALINADGYSEWNAGVLPFQISEINARRRMNTILRRLSPGLLVGSFTIGRGTNWAHWNLTAGDRIIINHPIDGVINKTFIIESISPLIDSQLAISAKEDPEEIYSDSFDLLGEGLVANRSRIYNENLGLNIIGSGSWRSVSVGDQNIYAFTEEGLVDSPNALFAETFLFADPNDEDFVDYIVLKRYIIDFVFRLGIKVRKIAVSLSIGEIKLQNEYELTEQETSNGIARRTFLDENGNPLTWEVSGLVKVRIHGQTLPDNIEDIELGPNYFFNIVPPTEEVIGDLSNVDARPPMAGVGLRYNTERELWIPAAQAIVVDELPTAEEREAAGYLPGTWFGKREQDDN